MNKFRRVAAEFGEPFADVVKVMAEQGQSKSTVCVTLGFHTKQFWAALDRFDLHKYFKPQRELVKSSRVGNRQAKGGVKGKPIIKNRKPIVEDGVVHLAGTPRHNYLYEQLKPSQRWRKQRRA